MRRVVLALAALLILVGWPASASTLRGTAAVIDGDTLFVEGHRVRLSGIDAPEYKQTCGDWACGLAATGALESLSRGIELRCETEGRDRYGRDLATCWRGAIDVNDWMVERGFALAYRKYSSRYVAQEEDARAHGRAIWRTEFQPPWLWRAQAKQPSTDERIRDLQRQLDEQATASRKGAQTTKARADRHVGNVLPIVESIRASGITTLTGIAEALNARGIRTARGGSWYPMTVRNLIARAAPAVFPHAAAE